MSITALPMPENLTGQLAAPECKALAASVAPVATPEVVQAFEDFSRQFAAYQEANDSRLKSLEKRQADVLSDERLARIDAALDESRRRHDRALLDSRRPQLEVAGVA